MSGLIAWQFLIELGHDHPNPLQAMPHRPPELGPETTVLVNGAAGGVGHFALQLAKWRGARVQLSELGGLLEAGTLRVAVDSTFPLEEARRAHERAARGHLRGKIVLTVA